MIPSLVIHMRLLYFPFRLFLDMVAPILVLAPIALVVLAVALVILAAAILIHTRIRNRKRRNETTRMRDDSREERKGS